MTVKSFCDLTNKQLLKLAFSSQISGSIKFTQIVYHKFENNIKSFSSCPLSGVKFLQKMFVLTYNNKSSTHFFICLKI